MTDDEVIQHLRTIRVYSTQDGYTDEAKKALDTAIETQKQLKSIREVYEDYRNKQIDEVEFSRKIRRILQGKEERGDIIG